MAKCINNRFVKDTIIGQGNFGTVYQATDLKRNKLVALKMEKESIEISQLETETKVMKIMRGSKGFPKLIEFGSHDDCKYLAMQLLGPSLEEKFQINNFQFSPYYLCVICEQILNRIQSLHENFYIHRDIKPRQFLVSPKKGSNTVYMIDFGLAKLFQNGKIGLHIQYMENRPFVGTANYASINTHLGIQQSRRDDLESYMYTLSYFVNGTLP